MALRRDPQRDGSELAIEPINTKGSNENVVALDEGKFDLGLVTGASAMGAIFAAGSGATDIATAPGQAVATGMAVTFAVASILILIGIGLVVAGSMFAGRKACPEPKP